VRIKVKDLSRYKLKERLNALPPFPTLLARAISAARARATRPMRAQLRKRKYKMFTKFYF